MSSNRYLIKLPTWMYPMEVSLHCRIAAGQRPTLEQSRQFYNDAVHRYQVDHVRLIFITDQGKFIVMPDLPGFRSYWWPKP